MQLPEVNPDVADEPNPDPASALSEDCRLTPGMRCVEPAAFSGAQGTSCQPMACSADGALLINGAPCDAGAARFTVEKQQPVPLSLSMHQSLCHPHAQAHAHVLCGYGVLH